MDRNIAILSAERVQLEDKLTALGAHARIRPASVFDPMDEASFYAEDGAREFIVFVAEDATWGPKLSHYIEPRDGLRQLHRMTVDVPNEIGDHVSAIQQLFAGWFAATE